MNMIILYDKLGDPKANNYPKGVAKPTTKSWTIYPKALTIY